MAVKVSDQTRKIIHLAVAGPATLTRLDPVLPEKASGLAPRGVRMGSMLLAKWIALRVGYTGTYSIEVILPNMLAWQAWRFITQKAGANCIPPVGLAARDVLRLEAGLPRYGHELNETIDPFTAQLDHLLDFRHDFLGRSALEELRRRPPSRRPAGLIGEARGPIPTLGSPVADSTGREIGAVTSGTFSPTLEKVIALGYVTTDTPAGAAVQVQTPTGPAAMTVTAIPFVR
jgi:aminomethyltransferase